MGNRTAIVPARRVLVIGHRPQVDDPTGAGGMLRQLGAEVLAVDLWDDLGAAVDRAPSPRGVRAIVVEAGDRPDLAPAVLRTVRKVSSLTDSPTLVTLPPRQITSYEKAWGFDDFIVVPCVPAEIYARIRALEWARSEFATEERVKVGALLVDRAAHEVTVEGRQVPLTAKEFALLAFLAAHRGRVFTREALLARVWGGRYEGSPRTVDIHVRRLRAKLGEGLPLETLRGSGYKLRVPSDGSPR